MQTKRLLLNIILVLSVLGVVSAQVHALAPIPSNLFRLVLINSKNAIASTTIHVVVYGQSVATSPPPLPSSYYGSVSVEGVNAPPGAEIRAWVNGVAVAAALVQWIDETSVYDITVPADHPETPAIEVG